MSDRDSRSKAPKWPPLNPPRPTGPANRKLAEEEQLRQLKQRQSDHEVKVDENTQAFAAYAVNREKVDRDLGLGVALLAQQAGVTHLLPESLQALTPPKAEGAPKALHEDAKSSAKSSARGARATYAVLAISILKFADDLGIVQALRPLVKNLLGAL